MSCYAVFGMSRERAHEMGRDRAWKKIQAKDEYVPPAKLEELAAAEAEKIMAGVQTVQLSTRHTFRGQNGRDQGRWLLRSCGIR